MIKTITFSLMLIEKKIKNLVLKKKSSESFYIEKQKKFILIKKENNLNKLNLTQISCVSKINKNSLELRKKSYLSYMESILQKQTNNNILFHCYSINDSLKTASSIGFLIAKKLENKIRFPKIKRELFDQIQQSNFIEGIRISCSGSLKGGLMAKTYTYKLGATSLQVFSKKIDYHCCHALTKYGSLGIKVWVAYK